MIKTIGSSKHSRSKFGRNKLFASAVNIYKTVDHRTSKDELSVEMNENRTETVRPIKVNSKVRVSSPYTSNVIPKLRDLHPKPNTTKTLGEINKRKVINVPSKLLQSKAESIPDTAPVSSRNLFKFDNNGKDSDFLKREFTTNAQKLFKSNRSITKV